MFLRLNIERGHVFICCQNGFLSLSGNRRVHARTNYTEQSAAAVYTAHQAAADLLFFREVESVI